MLSKGHGSSRMGNSCRLFSLRTHCLGKEIIWKQIIMNKSKDVSLHITNVAYIVGTLSKTSHREWYLKDASVHGQFRMQMVNVIKIIYICGIINSLKKDFIFFLCMPLWSYVHMCEGTHEGLEWASDLPGLSYNGYELPNTGYL